MGSRRQLGAVVVARSRGMASGAASPAASTSAPAPAPSVAAPAPAPAQPKRHAGGLLDRLSSFLIGAGIGLGVGVYHLNGELQGSSEALAKAIDRLERR
ncbi:unnamed protein product [Phaeothamnion confervicola]